MTNIASLHALFADACFGVEPPSHKGDLASCLERYALAAEDAEALLASPRRLGLYRRLVRHNVVHVIGTMLEQTRARFEHHVPGAFERTIDAFLASAGPRTPHLRDVPSEFLTWAAPRWRADGSVARWLVDYAEYELVEFTVSVAPRFAVPPMLVDIAMDRTLVFAAPHVMVHLGWAVHLVTKDDVASQPDPRAVSLLVYRDATHQARFLELSPLAASILERLFAGRALGQAMLDACNASKHVLDDTVALGVARLLADLAERGVLLGAPP